MNVDSTEPEGDESFIQQGHVVEVTRHCLQVMVHNQHRFSFVAESAQQFENDFLGGRVHAGHGLIHKVQIGTLCECPREKHALLLSTGKLADLPLFQIQNPDAVQTLTRPGSLFATRAAEPSESAVGPHQDGIQRAHGKVPVDAFALWNVTDDFSHRVHRLPKHSDSAGCHRNKSENRLDQSTLARAIWADDSNQPRIGNSKVDVPQHRAAMIRNRDVMHIQNGMRLIFRVRPCHVQLVAAADSGAPLRASAIVSMLCWSMPRNDSASLATGPNASENNSPPRRTS